jgi:hypothetical protein
MNDVLIFNFIWHRYKKRKTKVLTITKQQNMRPLRHLSLFLCESQRIVELFLRLFTLSSMEAKFEVPIKTGRQPVGSPSSKKKEHGIHF